MVPRRLGTVHARLPLFPLGTVLFPGLLLPLHVFEERYRLLVKELTSLPPGEPRRFGVVAIRRGREVGEDGVDALYDVGCTAELRRVTAYDDGRYDLITSGVARFKVLATDDSQPYLSADVDLLPETVGSTDEVTVLAEQVRTHFGRYLEVVATAQASPVEAPELPDDPLVLSYLVAATMLLDLGDRQRLLAEETATGRLTTELAMLRRETAMLRTLRAAPATDLTHGTHHN